jgi:hypothetical protein
MMVSITGSDSDDEFTTMFGAFEVIRGDRAG